MNRRIAAVSHGVISFLSRRVLRPVTKDMTYTIRHGFARGMRTRGGLDFVPRPRSREVQFLSDLSLEGKVVFDVGGFEGLHTLGFSRAVGPAGRVVTFEPNPAQFKKISRIVELNNLRNVDVLAVALGSHKTTMTLVVPVAEPSMASMESHVQERVAGMGETTRHEIEVETLDALIAQKRLPPPDLVKIDVEGAECDVLRGMADTLGAVRPALFIEIHEAEEGDASRFARETADLLVAKGYRMDLVEGSWEITVENAEDAIRKHLYCTT